MSKDTRYFMPFIKELNPKVIFEFGTYDGEDALQYRNEFPDADIYCFEPDPVLYTNALHTFEKSRIKLFDYAISNRVGKLKFYPTVIYQKGIPGPSGSLLKHTEYHIKEQVGLQTYYETIFVDTVSISEFCKVGCIKTIDYMHIDVEGATAAVLYGFGNIRPKLIRAEVFDRDVLFEGAPTKKECENVIKWKNEPKIEVVTEYETERVCK